MKKRALQCSFQLVILEGGAFQSRQELQRAGRAGRRKGERTHNGGTMPATGYGKRYLEPQGPAPASGPMEGPGIMEIMGVDK